MLANCYLVHGSDAEQNFKIVSSIKVQAKEQGYHNYEIFEINKQFAWEKLFEHCQNRDLFADKTLLDLRITVDSLNKDANEHLSKFLQQYVNDPSFCILVSAQQLKPAAQNTKWFKTLQANGKVHLSRSLPPVFKLTNAVLDGDMPQTIKLLKSLKNSGLEPILILWGLTREVRQLLNVKYAQQSAKRHQQRALDRLSSTQLHDLLRFSSYIDTIIKGIQPGEAWNSLSILCLNFANPTQTPLPIMEDLAICNQA